MSKKKIISILGLFIISPLFVQTFSQGILTPKEAVEIALKNNYQITLAANQKEIAENNYSAGKTTFLPQLDLNGSYTKSKTDTKIEFYDGRVIDQNGASSNNLTAGATLTWTIFDGLKMFAAFSRLKEMRNEGELNLKSAIETNILEILSTYFNIVKQKQVLDVIAKNITISEERVKIANSKLEYGSGSKFDLLGAQVDLNADKSSFLKGQNDLLASKVKLNQLLGRDPNFDFYVIDSIEVKKGFQYDDLKSEVKENNTDLKLAEQNKNISKIDLRLAQGELFPEIDLNLGYNYNKSESQAGFTKSSQNNGINYGISATFNLFNGLQTRNQIQNAEVGIMSSNVVYQQTENSVYSDLLSTYRRYKNSLELVQLDTQNLKVAEENVNIAVEKLRLGNITQLEFRESQTKRLSAKSDLVSAQYDAKVAETELLKLSGLLVKGK